MTVTIGGAQRKWIDLFTGTGAAWMHSGVTVTDDGHVVVASPEGDALVFIGRDGTELRRVPTGTTDLHGIVRDVVDGVEIFWLVDHGHKYVPDRPVYADHRVPARLVAVTTDGAVVHELHAPDHPAYADRGWSPYPVRLEVRSSTTAPLAP